VVAIASPRRATPKSCRQARIKRVFTATTMLAEKDIEMVTIAAPNYLHAQMTSDIANAGKPCGL